MVVRFRRYSVLLCVALATAACSEMPPTEPPTRTALAPGGKQAPDGYTWKKAQCMHVLIPDGWFYMEQKGNGTKAFFVSKESIEREGKFKTGLSSNIIINIRKKTGIAPSANVIFLFDSLKNTSVYRDIRSTRPAADMTQLSGLFQTKSPSSGNTIVQYLTAIGNDKTGTMYIVQFETHEADWDKNAPIANALIHNLVIDDTC